MEGGEILGIFDFFKREPIRVNDDEQSLAIRKQNALLFQNYLGNAQLNSAFKIYGIQLCINKIANAITKCDFQTYKIGKLKSDSLWYQLNVEPNKNQNASEFWNKVIYQMVSDPEGALIIQSDSHELLVADSYLVKKYAVVENVYSGVMVDNYQFKRSFLEHEVLHLKLNNSKVKTVVDGVYSDFGKIISGAISNYNRSNALKFIVNIDTVFDQMKQKTMTDADGNPIIDSETGQPLTEYDYTLDDLFSNRLKGLMSDNDSVTPMESGLILQDMNASGNSKSSGSAANKTTRDIMAMFDDVINLCADAFSIPRGLLKGDTADAGVMTDNFISFAISPLAEQIEDEINRKMYGKKSVLKHTYLKIKTDKIRNNDIASLATSAELMSRIGAFSVNDILDYLDKEQIKEDWADKHVISKNYALVEDVLKGGDLENEENENSDNVESDERSGTDSTD